jgi:hypothetical protein
MRVDETRKLLFVAGGIGGHVYVYSTRDGSQVADITVGRAATFTNDVALTRHAKYDLGFPPPFGPGAPPGTPFEVITVRR